MNALLTEVLKGAFFASAISLYALKRKSLNKRGTAAAWVVFGVTYAAGKWHVAILLTFFFTSSLLTKVGKATKKVREEGFGESEGRDEWQVLANGGLGTALAALWVWAPHPALLAAYLAQYAVVTGDTWSSEVGILSTATPRLILGFKKVPHGTNGGITPLGTSASIVGGAVIGAAAFAAGEPQSLFNGVATSPGQYIMLGALGGLVGSSVDSILGQVFEYSGWDEDNSRVTNSEALKGGKKISGSGLLSNGQVNFASAVLTSGLAGVCTYFLQ